jgi:hypothetical protein
MSGLARLERLLTEFSDEQPAASASKSRIGVNLDNL